MLEKVYRDTEGNVLLGLEACYPEPVHFENSANNVGIFSSSKAISIILKLRTPSTRYPQRHSTETSIKHIAQKKIFQLLLRLQFIFYAIRLSHAASYPNRVKGYPRTGYTLGSAQLSLMFLVSVFRPRPIKLTMTK